MYTQILTFLASLRVCPTQRRPPQVSTLLTQPEATENDVGALTPTWKGVD